VLCRNCLSVCVWMCIGLCIGLCMEWHLGAEYNEICVIQNRNIWVVGVTVSGEWGWAFKGCVEGCVKGCIIQLVCIQIRVNWG